MPATAGIADFEAALGHREHFTTQSPAGADMVLLREAAAAYKSNDKEKARALLIEAASHNPANELVWMWRTSLARTVEEALEAAQEACVDSEAVTSQASWDELRADRI